MRGKEERTGANLGREFTPEKTASREAGNGSKFGFASNIIMVTIVKSL